MVRDMRHIKTASGMFRECVEHLKLATGGENIQSVMTIFRPKQLNEKYGPRFWNSQLIRYAAYPVGDGETILGDPANLELTEKIIELGWNPPEPKTEFDILPLVIDIPGQPPAMFTLPAEVCDEVEIWHPKYPAFADL